MNPVLLAVLVLGPLIFAAGALVAPTRRLRSAVVMAGSAVTAGAGIFAATVPAGNLNLSWSPLVSFAIEALMVLVVLAIAIRIRSLAIGALALGQLALVLWEEFAPGQIIHPAHDFVLDGLSVILILVVTVIGSAILLYSLGYMKRHEEHAPPTARGNGQFFFFLVGFLGVMNGLVLADQLRWLSIFWEATTLCSFFLIGHDGTELAKRNAKRALLINTFGGLAMVLASLLASRNSGADSLSGVMAARALVPMALLCLAAMTKSAQLPFQSWLLGAMVAPTPVSALLHSATMVKAGSYVILRLAPAFAGTKLMYVVAIAGAFTFALASALAVSQSNAKKVLAYSTISNLGLIVTCAGINTPLAYAAGVMILCFHAASKGLLFLCVGTIEQEVGSREIEDMGGIMFRLPLTAVVTLIGMVSMLIPPFGMLLAKWMAIEAAIRSPIMLVLLVIGSALTVVYWAKWIGRIQTVSYHEKYQIEKLPFSMLATKLALVTTVVLAGVAAVPIYKYVLEPLAKRAYPELMLSPEAMGEMDAVSGTLTWPVFLFLAFAILAWLLTYRMFKPSHVRLPFMCGENVAGVQRSYMFRSVKDEAVTAWSSTLYMKSIFEEGKITLWANMIAWILVLTMFGVLRLGG